MPDWARRCSARPVRPHGIREFAGYLGQTVAMRTLMTLLLLAGALVLTGAAAADGDPASDVLLSTDVYTPYPAPPAKAVKTLADAITAASAKGDHVKVAVIGSKNDLGSVPSLFNQPRKYARFLGAELSFFYTGALLVVMPSGFGFANNGKAVPAAEAALAHLSVGDDKSAAGLTLAAARAVPELKRARVLHYKDTFKPRASPLPTTAAAGHPLTLRYQAWDDSGRAKVDIQIQNAHKAAIASFHIPLQPVVQGQWYSVTWRVPKTAAHKVLNYCVRATDAAGNRGPLTCGKLTVT
jgi:hypothetical protein